MGISKALDLFPKSLSTAIDGLDTMSNVELEVLENPLSVVALTVSVCSPEDNPFRISCVI